MSNIDTVRNYVRVIVLGTGEKLDYGMVSPRRALVLAALQHGDKDFRTWEYETSLDYLGRPITPKVDVMGQKVVTCGPEGRTATLEYRRFTYTCAAA